MTRVNPDLFQRLQSTLQLSQSRVYRLIDDKVRTTHLPRPLAAIALASERGISISRYASAEDLATIRQAALSAVPPPVIVPAAQPAVRSATPRRTRPRGAARTGRRGNTVFVVHGRNVQARDAMFVFLRSIGLRPLEWAQAIRMTKQPTPYIGTILDVAFREAAAVVVLLTPDDQARLRPNLLLTSDPSYERTLTGQARPNVLFEAGMAFGRDPNSTVLAQVGEIRPFSDVAGRHIVRLTNQATSRQEFVIRLANAGCNVDTSGSDWLSAGDFRASPRHASRRPHRKRRAVRRRR